MSIARPLPRTSIALAGSAAIALSALLPAHDEPARTVTLPDVHLTDLTIPAFGAIAYQIGINTIGNLVAAAPIMIGSTEQCTVCLGPNTPSPDPRYAPFSGWGLIGLGNGLVTSPFAFVKALQAGQDVGRAIGLALLDIQVPITNTLALLLESRVPQGGFALQATVDRILTASRDALVAGFDVAAQALVTGPLTVVSGVVAGATVFAGTLATTGDVGTAFTAGRAPVEQSVDAALNDLTFKVGTGRARVYADLTAGPGVATAPIPTVPAPTAATKALRSAKAAPATSTLAASIGARDTAGPSSGAAPKHSGVRGSKRQHKARSAD
ncbi:hypothetical protein B1R94_06790 [Mycolicibacterium litorale]|nr:hypothetical protein B1R94_06790 [Mycolicibacterium litorale]